MCIRDRVKMVSILEYDKEWEEKKLRKAEYEAGKNDAMCIRDRRYISYTAVTRKSFRRVCRKYIMQKKRA